MLLNLHTGRVKGYTEGQEPIVYLVTSAQFVQQAGAQFVFSNGHGLANFTNWFTNLVDLDKVDWDVVKDRYWSDTPTDNDRQRRKQAEFLIWHSLAWPNIQALVVMNQAMKTQVEGILLGFPNLNPTPVYAKPGWYY
jgi:hypothetical protein